MEPEPNDEQKLEEIMSSRENSSESSPMHDFVPVYFDYPIQMKAIKEELGDNYDKEDNLVALKRKMQGAGIPASIWKHALRELRYWEDIFGFFYYCCSGQRVIRISLGGVKDEADIRGRRRTYIRSMPKNDWQSDKAFGMKHKLGNIQSHFSPSLFYPILKTRSACKDSNPFTLDYEYLIETVKNKLMIIRKQLTADSEPAC
ncbi:hypothetical protein CQW23_26561 [Capsicum baccatum]|uniref:Uncharacterized protein n=1 Tax=Capsicum baccatum TaxID=33114 RepID=A0A2G2VP71_CAPBA|nr:hypothetical protein CQW23_26561 [Capsicum baccatum]